MRGMNTKSVHEFLISSVGLLLVLSLRSAAPNALVSGQGLISFSLSDGDNVTCYPIEAQISLNGTTYNRYPTTMINPGNYTYDTRGAKRAWQTMAAEVGACPDGTIPIRAPRSILENVTHPVQPPHEYGVAKTANATYKGTEVFINLWDPRVENVREFSLGQLWLVSGHNTIEAGYQVYKRLYGDSLPRLFVYWTANLYNGTGCQDLNCSGFVQVTNQVLLGGSFSTSTISRQKGQQYEIKFLVFKDDGTGDWWLQLNDEYVGYWPKAIYNVTTPFTYAEIVQWGGEMVDNENLDGNLHTTTEMGSGKFAVEGYGKAAYQRNLQYVNMSNKLVDVEFFVKNTESSCYSAMKGTDFPAWRSFFFYGGKGLSSKCRHDPVFEAPPPAPPPAGGEVLAPAPTAGG